MLRSLRTLLATAVLMAVVFSASTALAAGPAWQRVAVIMHFEQSAGVMMVSGELAPDATLPATVALPVPERFPLIWIGEILGGPVSEDPEAEYVKSTVGASDVYTFNLKESRKGQIEVETAGPQYVDATTSRASLRWTALQDVPEVTLGVAVPQGATIVQAAQDATVQAGYYTKLVQGVKAGDQLDLTFAYSTPAAPVAAEVTTPVDPSSGILITLGILAVLAVVIIFAVWSKTRRGATDDDEPDAKPEAIEDVDAAEPDTAEPPARDDAHLRRRATLLAGGVVAVLLLFSVAVAVFSSRAQVSGDTISRTFATGEACANAEMALKVPGDSEPAVVAETLFAALKPIPGMNNATYDAKSSSVRIGYCGSEATEPDLRAALAPTGYLVE